jgi:hypothetical protein
MNVFPYQTSFSTILPPLKSVWLENWTVESIHKRVIDMPQLSNNVIITMRRKILSIKPDVMIANIEKSIGQPWSIRVRNETVVLKSANFSMAGKSISYRKDNKVDDFYNLTKNIEWPDYQLLYVNLTPSGEMHTISRLYICDQVELEPSEFLLNSRKYTLYIYKSKRVLFDNQFVLMRSNTFSEYSARICIDDSGLYEGKINVGAILKTFDLCFFVVSMLLYGLLLI